MLFVGKKEKIVKFKINKKLLCDVCGKPVRTANEYGKVVAFNCSNPACNNSVTFEVKSKPELPEWVVKKNIYEGIE